MTIFDFLDSLIVIKMDNNREEDIFLEELCHSSLLNKVPILNTMQQSRRMQHFAVATVVNVRISLTVLFEVAIFYTFYII